MSKYDHPVYEHPETGKVLNPATENWVTQKYARNIGLLEDAKRETARHFKQLEEKAKKAANKVNFQGDDEREVLSSQETPDEENKERLDETTRVEWDEDGNESRFDHDKEPSDADQALSNIMNDIDQADQTGKAVKSENFVDPEAAEKEAQQNQDQQIGMKGEEVEDFEPEFMNMPTFPGGVYSTSGNERRQQQRDARKRSRGKDPRKRRNARRPSKNKKYERTESGGMRVVNKDKKQNEDTE